MLHCGVLQRKMDIEFPYKICVVVLVKKEDFTTDSSKGLNHSFIESYYHC